MTSMTELYSTLNTQCIEYFELLFPISEYLPHLNTLSSVDSLIYDQSRIAGDLSALGLHQPTSSIIHNLQIIPVLG